MDKEQISPSILKSDPNNKNWTIPRSYGVWELPSGAIGKKYRYGNNPIREKELTNEFGLVKLIALYINRTTASEYASRLNDALK